MSSHGPFRFERHQSNNEKAVRDGLLDFGQVARNIPGVTANGVEHHLRRACRRLVHCDGLFYRPDPPFKRAHGDTAGSTATPMLSSSARAARMSLRLEHW
jgi:hypothetical protein